MRRVAWIFAVALAMAGNSALAGKFQYFVFPLTDIVGIDSKGKANSGSTARQPYGPLINSRALDEFFLPPAGEGQRRLGRDEFIAHFTSRVREAYPQAAVHPRQIGAFQQGAYGYLDAPDCNSTGFKAPIKDSYAVALSLTRLNYFEDRFDRYLQIFVPVTLSVQFVRPDGLQSVFTKSHTEYFGRELTQAEALGADGKLNAATVKMVREGTMAAAKRAVDALMVSAKTGFQPKESEVEVVDWSGDFVVLNRGPEVGFVSTQGFPVEGHEYFFNVLRTQPGWTVGRFVGPAPKLQKGQKLRFEFTSPLGKDDSKPDLMPAVYSDSPSAAVFSRPGSRASIAEYFSLDIGFSAPFNLVSLNASLDEVSSGIKSDARCVPSEVYEKMPGIGNVSSAKRQTPAYFVGFDVASSMNLRTAFQGTVGVTTRDSYRVLAAARIFDRTATVVHSALSEEVVENEISFGKGVSPSQVREVALKNASVRLTKELLSSLKFNPREYAVLAVERGRVKLGGAAKASVRNGELFRPLDIRVGGSRVIVPFDPAEVGVDGEPATQVDGQDLWVAVNDAAGKVRRGDVFRTADLIENREPIKHCGKPVFEIPNNALKVRPQVANLTVAHALTKSSRFNLIEPDQNAVAATNESLERGLFADTIKPRQEVQACFVPAIWVREESSQCERPDRCASTGGVGGGITIERNGQMWKRDMVNLRVVAPGVDPRQRNEFYDIKMFEALRASSDDLAKKIGGF